MFRTEFDSPLGSITAASDGEHLTGLWLEHQKYFGAGLDAGAKASADLAVFSATQQWLQSYFRGEQPQPGALPLKPSGSPFRQAVWTELLGIAYGETKSYGQIAAAVARHMGRDSMSSQAVGGAVGHNPISIIIPCHRVVGTNGSLTGYAGGIEAKLHLLGLENADLGGLFVPTSGSALSRTVPSAP